MRFHITSLCFALLLLLSQCQPSDNKIHPQFTLLEPEDTGISFRNDVPYNDSFNCYTFRNFYNGGGVGTGDVNNDGLPDLFFCGNMVSNKLYINRGNWKFDDATEQAGLTTNRIWTTGVALADINADGWLDIYICKSGELKGEKRHNELFINNADAPRNNGVPTFTEQAALWGLDNKGLSTHAAFFDYDKDGDLDCYLLNNSFRSVGNYDFRPDQRNIPDPEGGNKLLRNDGAPDSPGGGFHDVTQEAGIYSSAIGFGLGVTIGDYNRDGWQDIFVSNDFFERDYLYRNNQNGTFSEVLVGAIPEISKGSMGADMADLNNDGFPEIFVTEMTPADDARYKTKASFDDWNTYELMQNTGYHRQFGRNVLQRNNGDGSFSEIGRLAGVWATDWSWGALMADFDNDGWKDIFVANGIGKDLLDQDYLNFYSDKNAVAQLLRDNPGKGIQKLIDEMPSQPLPNYMFRNTGNWQFQSVANAWGLATPGFSNGSAYTDLDNDGDLDLVVNNVNMTAWVYKNDNTENNNWLKISLKGSGKNTSALGAIVSVTCGAQTQTLELAPMRGFESCVDPRLHFGLGQASSADEVKVVFPSGKLWLSKNVSCNQILEIREEQATGAPQNIPAPASAPWFAPGAGPEFTHQESSYSDFDREPLLFRMYSADGPKIAVADINQDDLEDVYIGGAAGQAGQLFVQVAGGKFRGSRQPDFEQDKACEDSAVAFFDADGDGDADLYVGSGSNEFSPGMPELDDRLYINDGKGNFHKKPEALPASKPYSTACIEPADVDLDGDIDLFAGMNMVPGHYGQPAPSFLLLNDGKGNFSPDMQKNKVLTRLYSVSDACWVDVDADHDPDLAVVGEWEPLRIFINNNGMLEETAVSGSNGWWNTLEAADLDGDGDQDLIAGNHGLNARFKASAEQPLRLYVSDFDQNGRDESIVCQYNGQESYPLVLRTDLVRQMPALKKKYLKFNDYKNQTIEEIFSTAQLQQALNKEVFTLQNAIFINQGGGKLNHIPLPVEAQISPVYAIATGDFNHDGKTDILLGGNHERCKPETGVYLASRGVILLGTGAGTFAPADSKQSGLNIEGSIRDLAILKNGLLLVARNNRPVLTYSLQ